MVGMTWVGMTSAQEEPVPPVDEPPLAADVDVLEGDDAPNTGTLDNESTAEVTSISELAARLLDRRARTDRSPQVEDKLLSYEPDPELLDHRTQELMASLGDHRISLFEAVKITLKSAPEIELAEQEVVASEGTVQSAAGQFDTHVSAGASYFRGQRELDVRGVEAGQRSFDRDKGFVKSANVAIDAITDEIQVIRDGGLPSSQFVRNPDGSVTIDGSFGLENDNASQSKTGQQDMLALERERNAALLAATKSLASPQELARISEIEKMFVEEGIANRKFDRKILRKNVLEAIKRIEQFPPNSILRTDVVTYDLAFVKQFRNGAILRPYVEFIREQDHLSRRRGKAGTNRTEFGLQLTIPLGKGRGYIATAGGEIASGFELDASRYQLQHEIAKRVLATTAAYWQVVASQERLQVLLESEMISGTVLNLADSMIANGLIPAVTRGQAVARKDSVRATRIRSEFDLLRAQQELVVAMGYEGDKIINAPLALDPFPPVVPAVAVQAQNLEDLVR